MSERTSRLPASLSPVSPAAAPQARLGLAASPAEGDALLQEARAAYGRLMDLDPLRRGYYQDAMEGRAFVVVQALGTV